MKTPKSINELNNDLFAPQEDERFSDPVEARKKAMDYLARREHGQSELIRKVCKFGFAADVAEAAVFRLTADGLQDDRRFVENFIQSRINQGKGPLRIHADLSQKGISSGLVDDVLAGVDVDWHALAAEVRRKKYGSDRPADFKEKARQMRFLQSRGFAQDHIQSAAADDGFD